MTSRKSISSAMVQQGDFDPIEAAAFIRQKAPLSKKPAQQTPKVDVLSSEPNNRAVASQHSGQLVRVTVRLDSKIASALKRASLERELRGENLYSQQDIVRTVLEPWLRDEGFLTESPTERN